MSNVYLPSVSLSSEEWEAAVEALHKVTRDAERWKALLILGGDFNASWLSDAIDAQARDKPLAVHRRLEASMQRAADLLSWIDNIPSLRVVVPEGGVQPTFVPYNSEQQPKVLDVVFCRGSPQQTARVCSLVIRDDWALRTGHSALHLCVLGLPQIGEPSRRDPSDPMRYVKLNRKRKVRRKWPRWCESIPHQVSSLIPDAGWASAEHIQRALLWAGRAAAVKGRRARRTTPFDPLENQALAERRVTQARAARRILALWVFKIRGYQKRWRFEQSLAEYTTRGKSIAKTVSPTGLVLSPAGTSSAMLQEFQAFWEDILQREVEEPPDAVRPGDGHSAESWAAAEGTPRSEMDLLVTHEDFVSPLGRIPKGKAGGEDGVLAEFVQALRPDHYGQFLVLISDTLLGRSPMLPGWKVASVSLIPKALGACAPKLFRPITVLPV